MRRTVSGAIAGVAALALAGVGSPFTSVASAQPQDRPRPPTLAPAGGMLGPDAAAHAPGEHARHGDHEGHSHDDVDRRRGSLPPTAAQRSADRRTGGRVQWNELGTPATVAATGDVVATGLPQQPEAAARAYLARSGDLFALTPAQVDDLETLAVTAVGKGAVVTLRQRAGGLPTTQGGLVTVAVRDGQVLHASSSLSRDTGALPAATLDEAAASDAAVRLAELESSEAVVLRVREVAVPTAAEGMRRAWEVVVAEEGGHGAAFTVLVDATSGELLVRESLVDHLDDDPRWSLFPATPADLDTTERDTWCWTGVAGCDDTLAPGASTATPWDVDPATGQPSLTTLGNNAVSGKSWALAPNVRAVERTATPSTTRDYLYTFDNTWQESGCAPEALTGDDGNDVDAATSSLFAHHNRLHDFAYGLGFTEETWNAQQDNLGRGGKGGDPEVGKAQSGAALGIRDNANQYSTPDGVAPWSNMYLWQPIAGAAYVPCVDGDFDGTVIGHEYTHLITNRMIAGPDAGLSGYQAGGMGESWSDLVAMEYLVELGERPMGDTPFVTGAYVTGDERTGIRNFDMSRSSLNYSNVGYDVVGASVHSEGEIWSATNFAVRQAFVDRYGAGTPAELRACAEGRTPVEQCPGSRRWVQLLFDSLLVPATGRVSMVDMRDAMLVADQLRFGGANQDLLWDAFASRGLGEGASSDGPNDTDPVPSFATPTGADGEVTFVPAGTQAGAPVEIFVGEFEDQSTPVADTDPATELGATTRMVAGTYDAVAVGPTVGHQRFTFTVRAGQVRDVPVLLEQNLAASALGATATGDGTDAASLLDGTEATDWTAERDGGPAGLGVSVDLAGDRPQQVGRVAVSAFYETGSRFSALRQFAISACDASTGADCADPAAYERVFLSPADAFPGDGMRPTAPDLNAASFAIPRTTATHLRLEVVSNQCTGGPEFAGELDDDPATTTDCATGAPSVARVVRAAELQAFRR
ncbi:M36 family metallopeptidase [Nocardioides perillae]|uniref:Fungalysin metallopeptidase (M36) n=1 Tax=Nocardioides perillae TaxID=1119534 RepID=A0A7Y9UV37_9ACTN|nr:M36 family metallopeptidase [Nocardioides perillae]NYG55155.1 hypothetical protein [Nocardioides perillae]